MIPASMIVPAVSKELRDDDRDQANFKLLMSATLLAGFVVVGMYAWLSQPSLKEQHTHSAKGHYQTAQDFARASAGIDDANVQGCLYLRATMLEMADNNLSYEDIGTTREKFEMLGSRFGCTPN